MQALATCSWRVAAIALLSMAANGVAQPVQALDWQVDITPAGELFPALQLSQARRGAPSSVGGGDGLVSIRVAACGSAPARAGPACAGARRRVHLRIETAGLRRPVVVEADHDPRATLILRPRLDWDVAALRSLHAVRHQLLQVTLEGETRTLDVRVHPLDDALYFVREGTDHVDLGWAFAAYVNPHAAAVDEVLALAQDIDPGFNTTATANPVEKLRRVAAIWAALEQHGLRYATGNPALSQGPHVFSQRVRLPDEAWRERRANCIDGSVLIASVLERLGIRAFIVLVPSHAFVRFDLGARPGDTRYLETTLLGATPRPRPDANDHPRDVHRSGADFTAALRAGTAYWRRVATRFDGRHSPEYALIDIETARAYGIIPLAPDNVAREGSTRAGDTPAERDGSWRSLRARGTTRIPVGGDASAVRPPSDQG